MSVQLILYPQNYQGVYQFNSSVITTNLVADGFLFISISSHSGYSSSANDPALDAITNDAPISNWKKFRSQGGSTFADVDFPVVITGILPKLRIKAASGGASSSSGIYQTIDNLVVGATYQLKFNVVNAATGGLIIVGANSYGNNLGGGGVSVISSTGTGFKTFDFTAVNSSEELIIDYQNDGADYIDIRNVTIRGAGATPPVVLSDLANGQVICDLSFNPYVQTQCVLKQDGNVIFKGFLKLIDIVNKEGEISYNVNLYSEPIILVDVLENKLFRDLDFSELEHNYNKTNIVASWYDSTGITLSEPLGANSFAGAYNDTTTTVLKYPFVDWTGDLSLNYTTNFPELNKLEDAFRPFIQCKYVLDNIFNDAGFTYTSDFFDSPTFTNLFMDFNWGAGNAPINLGSNSEVGVYIDLTNYYATTIYSNLKINFGLLNGAFGSSVDYSVITNKITSVNNNTSYNINYWYEIVVQYGSPNHEYSTRWFVTRNNGTTEEIDEVPLTGADGVVTYQGSLSITLDAGETAQAQFKASAANQVYQNFDNINSPPTENYSSLFITRTVEGVTSSTFLNNVRGDLKQWDFLKSIINMFNLIIRQDETNPTNLLVETYDTVFNDTNISPPPKGLTLLERNIKNDWTDKVDASEMKLTPLNLIKETIFDYMEDESDHCSNIYKESTNNNYGSKKFVARGNTLFFGSEKIESVAFAATVVKPLFDHTPQFITPAIFSKEDTTYQSFDNLPRILYKTSASPFQMTDGTSYKIPAQNGVNGTGAETKFLQFSHTTDMLPLNTSLDLNFGTHQLMGIPTNTVNSLYQEYWSSYFNELYNFDTKSMTLKVNLNAADINQFNFNEKVIIMNRSFRVNKIDYKPTDLSTVEFILIP